jgi:hypothetical protein
MLNKTVNNGAAAKKSRMGKKSLTPLVLEIGWPDLAEDGIARRGVREGEQLEVRHDAFLGDLLQ